MDTVAAAAEEEEEEEARVSGKFAKRDASWLVRLRKLR